MNNQPGWYAVKTHHDAGETTIFTFARNSEAARSAIMKEERCPERSILSVERRAPDSGLQPELAKQVFDLGYEIIFSKESDDCFIYSARSWVEDSGDFDSKTEAAEFLIKEKS